MKHSFDGRIIAVWGAARSGIAVSNLLVGQGAQVVLSDNRSQDQLDLAALDKRVELHCGSNTWEGAEILVPSPGIPPSHLELQEAVSNGVRLMSEIEVAARFAVAPIVAITGTDGKTTTTEMTAAAIRGCGVNAIVAGNIGDPFSARVLEASANDVLVIEVSAFQLWSAGHFSPDVAIITNVAGDHADYFLNDVVAYADAKARVLSDMKPGSVAILRGDDSIVTGFTTPSGVKRVLFRPAVEDAGWGISDSVITHDGVGVMSVHDLSVSGIHNLCNAQAALAAGIALGQPLEGLTAGLRAFRGLPHRTELIRERDGVRWINDSKATNPHAAAAGLRAQMSPTVVITGGFDKGLDLKPLMDALHGARHIIVTGTTAERTVTEINGRWPVSRAGSMQEAVRRASEVANRGDVVILSPAASSFDAYRSYAHRGDVFKEAVLALE